MQIRKVSSEQMTNLVELPSVAILTVQVPHSMKWNLVYIFISWIFLVFELCKLFKISYTFYYPLYLNF